MKKQKNQNLWNLIVNRGAQSPDKTNKDEGRAKYSSRKELLLEYIEQDSGRVSSARQRAELDIRLRYIVALLNLHSGKKGEVWIPNS